MPAISDLSIETKFVGRDKEMGRLEQCLDDAFEDRGNFVLIEGEAGIGKTRLITELSKYAESKGVRVLSATCFEHATPYLPFINALEGITTFKQIVGREEEVIIEDVLLIYNDGRMLVHETRRLKPEIDSDILSGMFTAVQTFIKDSFKGGKGEELNELKYGEMKIPIERGKYLYLAVIVSGEETATIREQMKGSISEIEEKFDKTLKRWDGDLGFTHECRKYVKKLVGGGYRKVSEIKIDPVREKERMFALISDILENMSKEQPLMLFLDDLHWADESSFALLHYIARSTLKSRIFVVGAYRPEELIPLTAEERTHGLTGALRKMSKDRLYKTIKLDRLEYDEIKKMLDWTFVNHTFSDNFVNSIYDKSGGNPYFSVEILRTMIESDILYTKNNVWYAKDMLSMVIPDTIEAVISRRVDRVGDRYRNLLNYCSVIGQKFDFNILQGSVGISQEELVDALEFLTGTKIIHDTKDGKYIFDHPMIREVIYSGLSGAKKMLMHKKVANSIELLNRTKIYQVVYELAHHYSLAEDAEKSFKYNILAGDKARISFAPNEAMRYYKDALDILNGLEETPENNNTKLELLTNLGESSYWVGEYDGSVNYYNEVIKLSDALDNKQKKIESYLKIGEIQMDKAEYDEALKNMEKALKISENINDEHGIAYAYYRIGKVYWRVGKLDDAMTVLSKSLEFSQKVDDKSLMGKAYMDISSVHSFKGEYEKCLDLLYNKSLSISESINDKYEIARAYNNIGATYGKMGNDDKAIEWYEKCVKIGKEIGWSRVVGYGLVNAAENYVKKDELERAKEYIDNALSIFEKLDEKRAVSGCNGIYGMIYSKEKNWDKATEYFESSIKISKEIEDVDALPTTYFEYARMYKSKNEQEKAKEQFENAITVYEKLGNKVKVEEVRKEIEKLGVVGEKEIAEELKIQFRAEFVNREKEFAELKKYLDDATQNRGRLVFVRGEVGIGKTRIMEELKCYASSKNISYIKGKCTPDKSSEPYLPFVEVITDYFQTCKSTERIKNIIRESPAELVRLIPIMGALSTGLGIVPKGVPAVPLASLQTERERMFENLSQLVFRIGREEPIILLIENIQWVDSSSLNLIHYIARGVKNNSILICSTYRPEELRTVEGKIHHVIDRIGLMMREGLITSIELNRLDKDDIASMVKSIVDKKDLSDELVDLIYKVTEGNPLFVEEVLRALAMEGMMKVKEGKLSIEIEPEKIKIPKTIADIVTNSITRIDERTREILEYASVIGHHFRYDILKNATKKGDEELVEMLDKLIKATLITETPEKKRICRFYHPIMQKVTYDSLSEDKKLALHNEIGVSIEELNKERIDDVLYDLARHFTNAEEFEKAVNYSIRAGDKVKGMFAPDEALKYYRMALSGLEKLKKTKENQEKMLDLLMNAGEMYYVIGEYDESITNYNNAITLCEDLGKENKKIENYLYLGEIQMNKAEYDGALKNMDKALKISEKMNDEHGIADSYHRMGRVYWRVGKLDKAMNTLDKSLECAQKIDDKSLIARIYIDIGTIRYMYGEWGKAIDLYLKGLDVSKSVDDRHEMVRAYNNIGNTYRAIADWKKTIEWCEKCINLCKSIGEIHSLAYALNNAAEAYGMTGEVDKAEKYNDRAIEIFEKLGNKVVVGWCKTSYGIIYREKKIWDKAVQSFEEAIELAKETEDFEGLPHAYHEYGKMCKANGEPEKAHEQFQKSIEVYEKLGNKKKVEEIKREMEGL